MRILIKIIILSVLIFSCSGKKVENVEFKDDSNIENENKNVDKVETVIEKVLSELSLINISQGDRSDYIGHILDYDSIEKYVIKGYLAGDDYSVYVDLIEFQNVLVFIISRKNNDDQNIIDGSMIIENKNNDLSISHKLTKISGEYRDDYIVLVNSNEEVIKTIRINLDSSKFSLVENSELELIQEEY